MITLVLKGTSGSPLAFFPPSEDKARRQPSSQRFGVDMYTHVYYLKCTAGQRPTEQRTELCSTLQWQSGWETSLGENGYMYMCGLLCCPPETVTTLFVNRLYLNMKKSFQKKTAIYEPRSGPSSVIRSLVSLISAPRTARNKYLLLNHQVCGTFYGSPYQTKTLTNKTAILFRVAVYPAQGNEP